MKDNITMTIVVVALMITILGVGIIRMVNKDNCRNNCSSIAATLGENGTVACLKVCEE